MKLWMRSAATLTVALSLAGCSASRESKVVGTWKMRQPAALANVLSKTPIIAGMSLELRGDKTFTYTLGASMEGTWAIDEASGIINTTVTKVAGQNLTPAAALLPQLKSSYLLGDNDSTLTWINPNSKVAAGSATGLTFEKS